jgi:hypothetical protein
MYAPVQRPDWLLVSKKTGRSAGSGISFYIAEEIPILNAPQPDDDCLNHYLVGLLSPKQRAKSFFLDSPGSQRNFNKLAEHRA